MKLLERIYDVSDGAKYSDNVPLAQSLVIKNDSGCTAFLRIGGNDAPADSSSASKTLDAHSFYIVPVASGSIGIRFVASPDGVTIPVGIADGKCTVEWYSERLQATEHVTAGAVVSTQQATPQDNYPLSKLGEGRTTSGDYTTVDATGYLAFRIYIDNGTDDAVRVSVSQAITVGIGLLTEVDQLIAIPHQMSMWQMPLRSLVPPSQNIITMHLYRGVSTGSVIVTPVLLLSEHDYATNIDPVGAFRRRGALKNLTAGTEFDVVVPEAYAFAVAVAPTIEPAVVTLIKILRTNTAHTVVREILAAGLWIPGVGWYPPIGFGPVPFAQAIFVPSGDVICVLSDQNLNGVWYTYNVLL